MSQLGDDEGTNPPNQSDPRPDVPRNPGPATTGGRTPIDFSPPIAQPRTSAPPPGAPPTQRQPIRPETGAPRRRIGRWLAIGVVAAIAVGVSVGVGQYYRAQADDAAVASVEQRIKAVTTVTVASAEQIRSAQHDYDALRSELQARVSNHGVLVAAHDALAVQMEEVVLAQAAIDTWREHELCALAYTATTKYDKLDADQQALIDGGADLTHAVAECDTEAQARRAQEAKESAAQQAARSVAEEERKHNLIEISGDWYQEHPDYTGPGCLYWVTPIFTNVSNKLINYVWFDVSFVNRVGHQADDITGTYTHTLRIVGPIKKGETHDETDYGFDLIYSCGEVVGIQIESVTIEYGSGYWETIEPGYLQYAAPWSPKEEN